jgi:hypothetical protein
MSSFYEPTGGQILAAAPSRVPNNAPFIPNQLCVCDQEAPTNATETARVATIAFTAAITLRWFDVRINNVDYRIDLGNLLMTPATATDDIAKLKDKLTNEFGGVRGSLFGGAAQLTIAVVSTNLVVTITSVAAYLPLDIQTATASVAFV